MDLAELIAQVEEIAVSEGPLDRLTAAMDVKADVDELADSLIGHYVDQARRAGCSWSEIGTAMGVSKQAAQQRHRADRPRRERPPWRMLGHRWTDRAKSVVKEANGAAIELGHEYVGTEHLLLGMLAIPQGIAGRLLVAGGVTREAVLARLDVEERPQQRNRRHLPMTPRARASLVKALENAVRLGHNYIGTEHQLLGLLDVPEGIGAEVVTAAGLTKAGLEAEIVAILDRLS